MNSSFVSEQFGAKVKETLDPKKLSAGAGDAANPADGSRSAHGHAAIKWQVFSLIRKQAVDQQSSSCTIYETFICNVTVLQNPAH